MHVKKIAAVTAAAGLLLGALTACSSDGAKGDGASGDTFHLGYTATLSGDFASYGLEMREGVDLAVDHLNENGGVLGKQVKVTVADDEGKPANGPVVAQQFCDDSSISAVLGFSFSSVALSGLPIYTQCGLPIVASAVTSPELSGASDVFFRNIFTDAYQGAEAAKFIAANRDVKKMAILYQQDDYGVGIAEAFGDAFEAAGGTVTSSQAYQLGTVNFSSIVDSALKGGPDAVFIGGFYTETSKIVTQIRDIGSDVKIFTADGNASPLFLDLAGKAAEGVEVYSAFSLSDDRDEVKQFIAAYEKKYDKEPNSWAAMTFDSVRIVAEAAERAGSTDREAIKEALKNTKFDGVSGEISFDEKGDRVGKVVFQRVTDGKFEIITE